MKVLKVNTRMNSDKRKIHDTGSNKFRKIQVQRPKKFRKLVYIQHTAIFGISYFVIVSKDLSLCFLEGYKLGPELLE